MVGRGAALDGRLFLGWTDGSNPVPSSKESAKSRFLQQRVGHEPRGQNRTRSRPEPKVRIQLSPAASHTNPSIAAELLIERRSHQNWRRVMRRTGIVNLAARGMLAVSVARRIGSRGPLLAYCAAHSNGAGPQKGLGIAVLFAPISRARPASSLDVNSNPQMLRTSTAPLEPRFSSGSPNRACRRDTVRQAIPRWSSRRGLSFGSRPRAGQGETPGLSGAGFTRARSERI